MKIAIAGASGFIGSQLIQHLLATTDHEVVALSRSLIVSQHERLEIRQGDLYSLLDAEKALHGCDVAFYLVHSMSPSSRLSQGNFRNFDFLLADNFAKAAEICKLRQIIYVSGLAPDNEPLSDHLRSRLEVEETFQRHDTPSLTFRCGIVVGPGGSSFEIVRRVIERTPVVPLPPWSLTKTQVMSVRELCPVLKLSMDPASKKHTSYDIASSGLLSYAAFIKKVSRTLGKKKVFIRVPFLPRWLSKRGLAAVTGFPRSLIYPLADSLTHKMTVNPKRSWRQKHGVTFETLDKTIMWSLNRKNEAQLPARRFKKHDPKDESLVQSVQRLPMQKDWTMKQLAREYMDWLPKFLSPFVKTKRDGDRLEISTIFWPRPLLILEFSETRTFKTRELFYIVGGILAKPYPSSRLEFRAGPNRDFFIAAIHNFKPSLPWYLYRYTQALLHKWVMYRFGAYLKRTKKLINS